MLPHVKRSAGLIRAVAGLGLSVLYLPGPPAGAASHDFSAGGGLVYGVDSNPSELPDEARSAAFTQGEFDLYLSPVTGRRFGFLGTASGARRYHESSARDADEGWADLRGGIAVVPYVNGSRRVSFAAGGTYGAYRTTLIDPLTGSVYEQPSATSGATPIPDRLDFESAGGFLDLRWQAGRNLLFYLDAESSRRSYVNDYDEAAGLHPLDDRSVSFEPGFRARFLRAVILDFSWNRTVRRYSELPALDEDAAEVPGVRREYLYSRYQASVKIAAGAKWELLAGFRDTDRSDEHQGFYDSLGKSSVVAVGCTPAERTRLRLTASRSALDYPNAPVGTNPNGETRESDVRRLVALAEQTLPGGLTVVVQAGREESDDQDPAFVYSRRWVQAGVKMEFGP